MDMQKIAAKLATKYGEVTKGKHKGCQVALGNDPNPNKKVEGTNRFTQIIFLEEDAEKGRYDIEDLKQIVHVGETEDAIQMKIVFENDDECIFDLKILPDDKFPMDLIKPLFMKCDPVSKHYPNEKYRRIYVFYLNTMLYLSTEDLEYFHKFFAKTGLFKNEKWLKQEKNRWIASVMDWFFRFSLDQLSCIGAVVGVFFPEEEELYAKIEKRLGVDSAE